LLGQKQDISEIQNECLVSVAQPAHQQKASNTFIIVPCFY